MIIAAGQDAADPPADPNVAPANDDPPSERIRMLIVDPLGEAALNARRDRYNLSAIPTEYPDEDPYSPAYARTDIDETSGTILHFWFLHAAERSRLINDRVRFWFGGGFEVDKLIAHRFGDILAKLASGEARRWAARSPGERLAAVIALDQFSRSIFRGRREAFENDPLARELTMNAIASGEDLQLKPVERWFLYMPLEHSESATDQRRSLEKFRALLDNAPADARPAFASAYDYAQKHAAVIRRFGRFPHRNEALGRTSTTAELAFLKKPGWRF